VPNDRARLRFFVASTHSEEDLETTVQLVVRALRELESSEQASDGRAIGSDGQRSTATA
jgi:sugar (pentulose or hexulose) kinase